MSKILSPAQIQSYGSFLQKCINMNALDEGKRAFFHITSNGFKADLSLNNLMLDLYVKRGCMTQAHDFFNGLVEKNTCTWERMLEGCKEHGQWKELMTLFGDMESEGLIPNQHICIMFLGACAQVSSLRSGMAMHACVIKHGHIMDMNLMSSLISMYAKCGFLEKAYELHKELPVRSVVSWSAIIVGYAHQGQGQKALNCFKQMKSDGFCPDDVTILCVLSACGRSGLLDEAQMLFGNMTQEYGITPSIDHQTCMVVALGSAGHFDKAISVIKAMPYSDHLPVWVVLLGACRKWRNVKLGSLAFDQAVQLDSSCAAAYAIMSTIFSTAGLWDDAKKVDAMRLKYVSEKQ